MAEKYLIDSDVLIDILRNYAPAIAWLKSIAKYHADIHIMSAMEIIDGSRNKIDLNHNKKFIIQFSILFPATEEMKLAYQLLITHRLATGIGIADCMIAATAKQRGIRLYSFNAKHFRHVEGLDMRMPYQRK
ncbi:MAG: hypothetical protein B6242_09745 [Anaerolineaceae bacterium 4572_78]|nr:MAG: hypothetical protein B6242_09745 [Anaerolineaceae bacterium 4572_78]